MKTTIAFVLTSFILTIYSPASTAQINVVKDDILIHGTNVTVYYDTTGPALNFSGTGSGLNWDFTSVNQSGSIEHHVNAAAGHIKAEKFPTATTVVEMVGFNWTYYENTSAGCILLGQVMTLIDSSIYQYNYNIIKYPAKLNDSFSETGARNKMMVIPFGFDPDGPGPHPTVDSLVTFSQQFIYSKIEGEGKVKTPAGEFDALKQYNRVVQIDSNFMYANGKWQVISSTMSTMMSMPVEIIDTLYDYTWLAKGIGWPVFIIEFDPNNGNKVQTAQWGDVHPLFISEQINDLNFSLFPNPVNNFLQIECECSEGQVKIYDLNGRLKKTFRIRSTRSSIDLSEFESGNYLVELMDYEGGKVGKGLIEVTR